MASSSREERWQRNTNAFWSIHPCTAQDLQICANFQRESVCVCVYARGHRVSLSQSPLIYMTVETEKQEMQSSSAGNWDWCNYTVNILNHLANKKSGNWLTKRQRWKTTCLLKQQQVRTLSRVSWTHPLNPRYLSSHPGQVGKYERVV